MTQRLHSFDLDGHLVSTKASRPQSFSGVFETVASTPATAGDAAIKMEVRNHYIAWARSFAPS
jgi:hypothetical protein